MGVGGYASGPMLKAAQKAGIPTVLQEQNSYPGVTNKILAANADAICVAYPGLEKFFPADKITLTGNPVRKALFECRLLRDEAKRLLGFNPKKPLILVVGGSLGARTINNAIADGLDRIVSAGAQVLWQTGKNYIDECNRASAGRGDVQAEAFISDMATAYTAADLIVSRAGAGTISELQLLGKAVILVPSPNVAEDHQRKNALALADRGAARMVLDADAPARLVDEVISLLADREGRRALERNIAAMALKDADEKIVDKIVEVINH